MWREWTYPSRGGLEHVLHTGSAAIQRHLGRYTDTIAYGSVRGSFQSTLTHLLPTSLQLG